MIYGRPLSLNRKSSSPRIIYIFFQKREVFMTEITENFEFRLPYTFSRNFKVLVA